MVKIITISLMAILAIYFFNGRSTTQKIVPQTSPTPVPLQTSPAQTTTVSVAPKKSAVLPATAPSEKSPESLRTELEKFKAMNQKDVQRIKLQMQKDEINSLKKSILEDQETLKGIEASGTDIELYRMVKTNLEIRKQKLKKLLN